MWVICLDWFKDFDIFFVVIVLVFNNWLIWIVIELCLKIELILIIIFVEINELMVILIDGDFVEFIVVKIVD